MLECHRETNEIENLADKDLMDVSETLEFSMTYLMLQHHAAACSLLTPPGGMERKKNNKKLKNQNEDREDMLARYDHGQTTDLT